MIDTTTLPQPLQDTLADVQPVEWIPLPAQPGDAAMLIPVHVQATPPFMEPWEIDEATTTRATKVYRLACEHLAALVHGSRLSLIKASDSATLDRVLRALSAHDARQVAPEPERDREPARVR